MAQSRDLEMLLNRAASTQSRDLEPLLNRAASIEPEVQDWITRGSGTIAPVLPAVAISFAQRACSTAARGVDEPHRPIMLAGSWRTPIEWPLLDVVAAARIARVELTARLDEEDRWEPSDVLDVAGRALERRDGPTQLLVLVRSIEHELYDAAKSLAFVSAAPSDTGLRAADWLNSVSITLLRASGYALAAAAAAPEPLVTRDGGPWANVLKRYYQ